MKKKPFDQDLLSIYKHVKRGLIIRRRIVNIVVIRFQNDFIRSLSAWHLKVSC